MAERKENTEKFGVVFAIYDGEKIELEVRNESNDKYKGFTFIPGGKVESGETYIYALKREVLEEYGVEVGDFCQIGIIRTLEEDGTINFRHIFLVSSWTGKIANPENKMHMRVSLAEARGICKHPISQQVLDFVEEELSR